MKKGRPTPRLLLLLLSLIATPWLILISTTNALFLDNQADLGYILQFYVPFILALAACLLVGLLLVLLTRRVPALMPALWGYYLAGPFFLLFAMVRGLPRSSGQEVTLISILAACFALLALVLRRVDPCRAPSGWVWFGLLFIVIDVSTFASRFELEPQADVAAGSPASTAAHRGVARPNIYHLLFDGYQSDILPLTTTPETERDLRGFQYYPENTASSGRTRVSIPSVFIGRAWDPGQPLERFTSDAMSSSRSLLHQLSKAGYKTTAYMHNRFSFQPNLFDVIRYHSRYYRDPIVRGRLLGSDAFQALWLYRYAPRFLARRLLGESLIERIAGKRLAPKAYVTGSYATFNNFLIDEEALEATNRYTFVHLLLPHDPFLMNRNCELQKARDPLEQFRCANKMIGSFVRLLKQLGRFDNSLILVHGDHGLNLRHANGALSEVPFDKGGAEWNHPRSKALLLLKPAGQGADRELVASVAETSLLDIAPTILRSIGVTAGQDFDGFSLVPTPQVPVPRTRYYHYHTGGLTAEVYRFIVEDGRFEFDRVLGQAAPR